MSKCQPPSNSHNTAGTRAVNTRHREQYPNKTDEEIRNSLSIERKEKNRKSAKASRDRRIFNEHYLNQQIPKGITLKQKLEKLTNEIWNNESNSDSELPELNNILSSMVECSAINIKQYQKMNRKETSDEIIESFLINLESKQLNKGINYSDSDLELETNNYKYIKMLEQYENEYNNNMQSIQEKPEMKPKSKRPIRISVDNNSKNNNIKYSKILPKLSNNTKHTNKYKICFPKMSNEQKFPTLSIECIKQKKARVRQLNINGIKKYKKYNVSNSETTKSNILSQKLILLKSQKAKNRHLFENVQRMGDLVECNYEKPKPKPVCNNYIIISDNSEDEIDIIDSFEPAKKKRKLVENVERNKTNTNANRPITVTQTHKQNECINNYFNINASPSTTQISQISQLSMSNSSMSMRSDTPPIPICYGQCEYEYEYNYNYNVPQPPQCCIGYNNTQYCNVQPIQSHPQCYNELIEPYYHLEPDYRPVLPVEICQDNSTYIANDEDFDNFDDENIIRKSKFYM